mmetsp:Transcript_15083/g.34480  ORF Transcript_15083/g.34480 Transcript_15083/m.34480 type:complete len:281 (+) Transcript_15083:596-1438(+)
MPRPTTLARRWMSTPPRRPPPRPYRLRLRGPPRQSTLRQTPLLRYFRPRPWRSRLAGRSQRTGHQTTRRAPERPGQTTRATRSQATRSPATRSPAPPSGSERALCWAQACRPCTSTPPSPRPRTISSRYSRGTRPGPSSRRPDRPSCIRRWDSRRLLRTISPPSSATSRRQTAPPGAGRTRPGRSTSRPASPGGVGFDERGGSSCGGGSRSGGSSRPRDSVRISRRARRLSPASPLVRGGHLSVSPRECPRVAPLCSEQRYNSTKTQQRRSPVAEPYFCT